MTFLSATLARRLRQSGFPAPRDRLGILRRHEDITLDELLGNFPKEWALRLERNGVWRGQEHWRALAVNITQTCFNHMEAIALEPAEAVAELAILIMGEK